MESVQERNSLIDRKKIKNKNNKYRSLLNQDMNLGPNNGINQRMNLKLIGLCQKYKVNNL